MFLLPLSVLTSAACVGVIPSVVAGAHSGQLRSRWTRPDWLVEIYDPVGDPGFVPQLSLDNGTSWQDLSYIRLNSSSTVAIRDRNNEGSTFFAENIHPSDTNHFDGSYWVDLDKGGFTDEIFGVWDDRVHITADFSQSPTELITPGEWVPIPMSADVSIVNGGHCTLGVYSATVFYNDNSTPLIVSADGSPNSPAMEFHIVNMYAVKNITLSFGPIVSPGIPKEPLLVQYVSANQAPSVTASIGLPMSFCDVDE